MSDTISQRRVLQRQRVLPQLLKRRVQVLALRLVLPGEMPPLPNIRPPIAPAILRRPPLKAVLLALRVSIHRCRLAQHRAQVIEMRLRDRFLRLRDLSPPVDELGGRHPITQNSSSQHQQAPSPPTFCPHPAIQDAPRHIQGEKTTGAYHQPSAPTSALVAMVRVTV